MTTTYKGFNADWTCYGGFKYEIGRHYKGDNPVRCGAGGFHSCEMPLDVWSYYGPATSKFAVVEQAGEIARGGAGDDSKVASAEITIKAEIHLPELICKAVDWIKAAANANLATGYRGHAAATGDMGHAAATGYSGHAAATGDGGHAAATGDMGHAAATGYSGHAAATGYSGHAAATGYRGHAAATGDMGHAAATGDYGRAAATGDGGHAAATGYRGHAAATGDYGRAAATGYSGRAAATGDGGHAAATGDYGHAAATGDGGHAAVKGKNAIAAALGFAGVARAEEGGAIILAAYDDNYQLVAVFASKVGENGIEAGKAYRLRPDGKPELAEGQ